MSDLGGKLPSLLEFMPRPLGFAFSQTPHETAIKIPKRAAILSDLGGRGVLLICGPFNRSCKKTRGSTTERAYEIYRIAHSVPFGYLVDFIRVMTHEVYQVRSKVVTLSNSYTTMFVRSCSD